MSEDRLSFRRSWFGTCFVVAAFVAGGLFLLFVGRHITSGLVPILVMLAIARVVYVVFWPYALVTSDDLTIQGAWSAETTCVPWWTVTDLQPMGEFEVALIHPDESHTLVDLGPLAAGDRERLVHEIQLRSMLTEERRAEIVGATLSVDG